jgi:hypothetical protein
MEVLTNLAFCGFSLLLGANLGWVQIYEFEPALSPSEVRRIAYVGPLIGLAFGLSIATLPAFWMMKITAGQVNLWSFTCLFGALSGIPAGVLYEVVRVKSQRELRATSAGDRHKNNASMLLIGACTFLIGSGGLLCQGYFHILSIRICWLGVAVGAVVAFTSGFTLITQRALRLR